MTEQSERPQPHLTSRRKLWRDIIEILILVVTIYTVVNLATARAIVEGNSMQPNFATGQLVIVNRFAYFFHGPARGDVVVLHNPDKSCKSAIENRSVISLPFITPDTTNSNCEDLIKRVMGLPGENLRLDNGRTYINGVLLDEPYVKEYCSGCGGVWQLTNDQYFVMGDNRNNSYDSHAFGPINRQLLVGQAWIRYWPLPDARIIPRPNYPEIPSTYIAPTPTETPILPTAIPAPPQGIPQISPQGIPRARRITSE